MSEQEEKWNLAAIADNLYIHEIIFISLIALCFLGDVLAEISDRSVIFYWLLMAPVFFISSVISERVIEHKTGKPVAHFIKLEAIFWGSAFLAILLTMFLWHADAIKASAAGIIIHIILAHTMLLTGALLGARFYLIGIFLFITAWLTIAMSAKVGVTFLLAIPIIALGLFFERHYLFPKIKRAHDKAYYGDQ